MLSIPAPPLPVNPADKATGINASTMFQWFDTGAVDVMSAQSRSVTSTPRPNTGSSRGLASGVRWAGARRRGDGLVRDA